MIEETRLTDEEMREISHLLPGPEPELGSRPPGSPRPQIPVAGTRLDGNERRYLLEALESNWISSAGPFLSRFEAAFSAAVGCPDGACCSSGTAALHLALAALGCGPGEEVILPAFTMIATANAVRYTQARPVLVDSEAETWNMDAGRVEAAVTPRTRGIVAVHTYGHPADMEALRAIAARRGLFLLEDAAEAHGALLQGRPAGSLGDAACFSFYGNKVLSTGEGGMVTSADHELLARVRRLRDHAFSPDRHFWHSHLGYNYRMTNLQAAVGLAQTERLEELVALRRRHAAAYAERLARVPGLSLPREKPGARSVYWMYGVLVGDEFGISRDELRRRLARAGIETRTFFVPVHLQPIYYRAFRGRRFPVAEELCRQGLYLPSGPNLAEEEIDAVCHEIARARG